MDLYHALDEGRYADVAACFAADGEWHRRGEVLTGPARIEASFRGRDPELRVVHVISNLRLFEDQRGMRFRLCITLYSGRAAADQVPSVPGPAMVLTSQGLLMRSGATWKIRTKRTVREFIVEAPAREDQR